MYRGYFKHFRKMIDWPWRSDLKIYSVWNCLLELAQGVEWDTVFDGKRVVLNPGQFVTGRKKISKITSVHESTVQRILKKLESEQQIEQQIGAKSRLITITNWDEYHVSEQQIEQQVNNKRTTSEQQVNTIREVKEVKRTKISYPSDFLEFYGAYPIKKSKMAALKAWKSTNGNRPPIEELVSIIRRQMSWPEFIEFTPHPSSWLNQHKWEDEPKNMQGKQKSSGPHLPEFRSDR